ncbi:hypothetical protein POTOM_010875 [Populus tomentosa]|uniref:B box-type domain-containing protein n=1 Tax=Populus tomentosa TaxID=118781 RepID=A0A8X8DCS6_POPTO|nr:hypothetical protein POTOM_010875 [Populus tomentosa]
MVYYWSDAACLCLSCDQIVHSSNALSKHHSRTLLYERCNSQPTLVKRAEERISLCQNCDWMGYGSSTSASTHKRQTINYYFGCPSVFELSLKWPFILDFPSGDESTCKEELGLMSIAENSTKNTWGLTENTICHNASRIVGVNDRFEIAKLGVWHEAYSVPESSSVPNNLNQPIKSPNSSLSKLYCPGTKCPARYEDVDLYKDFNMAEMDLNLENYEELFGVTLNNSEELF